MRAKRAARPVFCVGVGVVGVCVARSLLAARALIGRKVLGARFSNMRDGRMPPAGRRAAARASEYVGALAFV